MGAMRTGPPTPSATPPSNLPGLAAVVERCRLEAGYTPPVRSLEALVGVLDQEPAGTAPAFERALARAGATAVTAALAALSSRRKGDLSLPVLSFLGRLAGETRDRRLLPLLLAGLSSNSSRGQRAAARGLGHLGDAAAEAPLLQLLGTAELPERKAIVDSLAQLGGAASLTALGTLPPTDADFVRRCQRAVLLISRRAERASGGHVNADRPLGHPTQIALFCRAGLTAVLREEVIAQRLARELTTRSVSAERVDFPHSGTLRALLSVRTALYPALVLPLSEHSAADPAERIARAITRPEALEPLTGWTQGTPRFRINWTTGGHHRALTWSVARAVAMHTNAVVNDSHEALWTLWASPTGLGELLLQPRIDPDPRFSYRKRDVPAASHPTLAAALARIAKPERGDCVWDPFVGSGLELVECARLEPTVRLWGTDVELYALEAARENIAAAGLRAELRQADARSFQPPVAPSLIVSNPPMGRRVARDGSLGPLLADTLRNAARVLAPGGRLVWLSPVESLTTAAGRVQGFDVENGPRVDLGGFEATVQIMRRKG
jgi:hypothetical protein